VRSADFLGGDEKRVIQLLGQPEKVVLAGKRFQVRKDLQHPVRVHHPSARCN